MAANDQKPPTQMPSSTRPSNIIGKLTANAATRLETISSSDSPSISKRRSRRPEIRLNAGAATAATMPGMVTISPAVPVLTPSEGAMLVSRPIGRNSVVTMTKQATVSEKIAGHGDDAGLSLLFSIMPLVLGECAGRARGAV